ncbi:MAG: cellulose synthase/poly-beta-1,6-N-acetylglucosamine synthase-like glycosyltransferase [Crocinitomix sp.]|jgi:cellulose synthase/poly-beta-1,6-N-acetylglucosamine synthase-like glycosyltransferase
MEGLFIFWFILNLALLVFVVHELYLMVTALIRKKEPAPKHDPNHQFKVTVQLPVYNEKYVIERLLKSAASLNYPDNLLEIQVLDDSTDETTELIEKFIAENERGAVFNHIRRADRSGFKAGALDYGLKIAKGEFIAVFDADFIIEPSFLEKVVTLFADENVGVVQTKWLHVNENYTLITRAQAIMLNTHFSIEQLGRSSANCFINFNGTAGIWRKSCISDAGGWHADTLTEDLDLSYRAQIKGWKFAYLFDVGSPAELPATFEAYRTQQHRWSKGAAECVRKNWKLLWAAKIPLKAKILGAFHLLNSSVYLLIIPLILLSPIIYYVTKNQLIDLSLSHEMSAIGLITTSLLILIFFTGNLIGQKDKWKKVIFFIPSLFTFFAMTSGISLYMIIGVIQGYRSKKSAFVRTPKFGTKGELKAKIKKGYDFKKEFSLKAFEAFFLCYGIFITYIAVVDLNLIMAVYGLIITVGYSLAVLFNRETFKF